MRGLLLVLSLLVSTAAAKTDPKIVNKPFHRIEISDTDNGGFYELYKPPGGGTLMVFEIGLSNKVVAGKLWVEADGSSSLHLEERPFHWDDKAGFTYQTFSRKIRSCWLRFDKEQKLISGVSDNEDEDFTKQAIALYSQNIKEFLPALGAKKVESKSIHD